MGVYEDLKKKIHSTSNSNFHFNRMDSVTRVWIMGVCDLIDNLCSCQHLWETMSEKIEFREKCAKCGEER